jgi:hypothetical protein
VQSILSNTCNQEGGVVKSDRVRQAERAAAVAHQGAAATGMQRIGAVELIMETNITWSHVDRCKYCPQTRGRQEEMKMARERVALMGKPSETGDTRSSAAKGGPGLLN